MFGRRRVKTHAQLVRDELSEGFGHFWQAAAHVAGGVGATVGPKWDSTRRHLPPSFGAARHRAAHGLDTTIAALAPLMAAARSGAASATRTANSTRAKAGKKESGMSRKRTTILVGLLAAGAAAGAAGAITARRRNRAKWDEYEQRGIQSAKAGAKSVLDTARSTVDAGAQRVAERAGHAMSDWADSAREGSDAATDEAANRYTDQTAQATTQTAARASDAIEHAKSKTDQFADKAATISKNSRN